MGSYKEEGIKMKWKALLIIFVVLGLTTTGALWVYQGKKAKEKALKEELTRPKIVLNNTDSAISDVYFAYKEGGLSKAREKAEKGNIVKLEIGRASCRERV